MYHGYGSQKDEVGNMYKDEAAALLDEIPNPTDDDIDIAMNGNICRCGTYLRIREAIHRAASATEGATQGTGNASEGGDR